MLGDTFVINGPAFSGTGFGFDATGTAVTATAGTNTGPLALLPNHVSNRNPLGGQIPTTRARLPTYILAAQGTSRRLPAGIQIQTLPSMHRPALCRYWANQVTPACQFDTGLHIAAAARAMSADLKRAIIMRPCPEDHPDFTGSNPAYQTVDQTQPADSTRAASNPCWDGVTPYATAPNPPQFSYDVGTMTATAW